MHEEKKHAWNEKPIHTIIKHCAVPTEDLYKSRGIKRACCLISLLCFYIAVYTNPLPGYSHRKLNTTMIAHVCSLREQDEVCKNKNRVVMELKLYSFLLSLLVKLVSSRHLSNSSSLSVLPLSVCRALRLDLDAMRRCCGLITAYPEKIGMIGPKTMLVTQCEARSTVNIEILMLAMSRPPLLLHFKRQCRQTELHVCSENVALEVLSDGISN